eukprot:TRINITY_DN2802_c0_g1_i4.p1 TRINITY_DN2802_c0_g1~~TRINITY_DN2802_c0_g1_i4.p1  ORF type:complete len:857 (-),score=210.70 TRINITY_DN2802_c0_g1_i4:68-2638(-)
MERSPSGEGWLRLRGKKHSVFDPHTWPRYYFRIQAHKASLSYYAEPDSKRLGKLDLSSVRRVKLSDERVIHLVVPDNHYFLAAETPQEHTKWTNLLQVNTLTFSKRMKPETVGHKYYSRCPDRIAEFCETWCNVDTLQASEFITGGAEVVKAIYGRSEEIVPTQLHLISLFWYFMARAALYDELFTSGVFRVDDPDGKIFDFMASVDGCYERISSHYPERFGETFSLHGYQRGYDIKSDNARLPAMKRTMLFFRLGDGTTVIKGEFAGCPPFWRKEFRTLSNAAEFTKHGVDFMSTRFKASSGMVTQRSEFLPADLHRIFFLALDILYPKTGKLDGTGDIVIDENRIDDAAEIAHAMAFLSEKEDDGDKDREKLKRRIYKCGVQAGLSDIIRLLEYHKPESYDPNEFKHETTLTLGARKIQWTTTQECIYWVLSEVLDPESQFQLKEKTRGKDTYKHCFSGQCFVFWMITHGWAANREEGTQIGEKMRALGVLCHVLDKHQFSCGTLLYTFTDSIVEKVRLNKKRSKTLEKKEKRDAKTEKGETNDTEEVTKKLVTKNSVKKEQEEREQARSVLVDSLSSPSVEGVLKKLATKNALKKEQEEKEQGVLRQEDNLSSPRAEEKKKIAAEKTEFFVGLGSPDTNSVMQKLAAKNAAKRDAEGSSPSASISPMCSPSDSPDIEQTRRFKKRGPSKDKYTQKERKSPRDTESRVERKEREERKKKGELGLDPSPRGRAKSSPPAPIDREEEIRRAQKAFFDSLSVTSRNTDEAMANLAAKNKEKREREDRRKNGETVVSPSGSPYSSNPSSPRDTEDDIRRAQKAFFDSLSTSRNTAEVMAKLAAKNKEKDTKERGREKE